MRLRLLLQILTLAILSEYQSALAQTTDDSFTFSEAVVQYSGYFYNPVAGYVDASGNVQKGRQITEHQTMPDKFRTVSGGPYNALTCSGFVVPVLCRFLYGQARWQQQLKAHWRDYTLGGAGIAGAFDLKLSADLTHEQVTTSARIQALIDAKILHADAYYFFTVSDDGGGHVGFIQVKADGTLNTFQYSDMNIRSLPANRKKDPTDNTHNINKYRIGADGTLLFANGDAVTPVPKRAPGGRLDLIMAQRTTMPGYYEGPFLSWYSTSHYGRSKANVQIYELTPPLNVRVIYTWSSQSRDLDVGVYFLGTSMGWSHPNNSPYMTWTGDDTGYSGSETVTVDLQKAFDDSQITTEEPIELSLAAGWYSPAGGRGPANVRAQLLRQDSVFSERQRVVNPSTQSGRATYSVGKVIVDIQRQSIDIQ